MIIKTFNIDKSKRLWIVILIAVSIAAVLIVTSFIYVYNKDKGSINNKEVIFNSNNYYAEFNLTTFSNKNQNTYYIKEWYLSDNGKENFRFDFESELKEKISYIITDNRLSITSNKQLNMFNMDNYGIGKKNLLSISTFFSIYNFALNNKCNNIFRIENKTVNKNIHCIIYIDRGKIENSSNEINEYKDLLKDGLSIKKLEVVFSDNVPKEYYVYNQNDEVIMGINYTKFNIKDKFDKKYLQI